MSGRLDPWKPSPTDWTAATASHLLRRTGFGPRPGDLELSLREGFEASWERHVARPLEGRTPADGAERDASIGPLLSVGKLEHLQAWWAQLLMSDDHGLRERMVLMWHDHFATSNAKVDDVRMMHRQNELFREHGLGDARVLLREVARDPAMLVWLDGNRNRAGAPNENFAREILELFALGIGNYDEQDIRGAARAFTGWGTEGRSFRNRPEHHDDGAKTIFGERGNFDGDGALAKICDHPAFPRHIARRLLQEFVEPNPNPGDVEALAKMCVRNDFHIGRTLAVLLRSSLFFSARARRSRIAGPVEWVVSTVRRLGIQRPPLQIARSFSDLGQNLFVPPSVKGWDGGQAWVHAGTWVARHNLVVGWLAAARARRGELAGALGLTDRSEVVPGVLAALLPASHPNETRHLEEVLASTETSAEYSTDEVIERTVGLVLTAPEYHLY